jgi:alpha-galactosidase
MISPFQANDGAEKFKLYRAGAFWSAEGRPEIRNFEDYGLEMSWQAAGTRAVRFGCTGSDPVSKYFPCVAVHDQEFNVSWGAAMAGLGKWELEVYRFCDFVNISGGLPARDTGNWTKMLKPNEELRGEDAIITAVVGDGFDAFEQLKGYQSQKDFPQPEAENNMPIIFNDWCTCWGDTNSARLMPIAERCKQLGVKYFVVDAGWFECDEKNNFPIIGDWNCNTSRFPGGMKAFGQKIKAMGMIPGLWFEFENIQIDTRIDKRSGLVLKLDGKPIRMGTRKFLDFRNPKVWQYLQKKVIDYIKAIGYGYVKVDYNASTGWGCDGKDSNAEEMRQQQLKVNEFFRHLRREIPELVLEICASGGHRLSPHWMKLSSMGSFSDVHIGQDIPIIAGNEINLIPLDQMQVWCTLSPKDDVQRIYYSITGAMMGRLCLSGEIAKLNAAQLAIVAAGCDYYRNISHIIKNGKARRFHDIGLSYGNPKGYQIIEIAAGTEKLLIIHTFANAPKKLALPLNESSIEHCFKQPNIAVTAQNNQLMIKNLSDFCGVVIKLCSNAVK